MGPSDIVGIDIGTCTMEACLWREGGLTQVPLNNQYFTYPSCMYVGKEGIYTGSVAMVKSRNRPHQLISHAKRLIGMRYNNPLVERDRDTWNCQIVPSVNDYAKFQVTHDGIKEEFTPIDVTATILRDVHEKINAFAGHRIVSAVVSVPATFNNDQRAATLSAARIAGFESVTLCTEPTAAAISYAYNALQEISSLHLSGLVMVYDLGGGTFDVSILRITGKKYVIVGNHGDSHLGGEDFDRALFNYCLQELEKRGIQELTIRQRSTLMAKCVETKQLFTQNGYETEITLPLTVDSEETITITSDIISQLYSADIEHTITLMRQCLAEASLRISQIGHIILVGGSSRLFLVEKLLREEFGIPISKGVNPDLAVSEGALLIGLSKLDSNLFEITDCTSFNIYLQTSDTSGFVLIPKSAALPIDIEYPFPLKKVGSRLRVGLYQGSDTYIGNDELLGYFFIEGIPELFRRHDNLNFSLKIHIDEGGIVHASVVCVNEPTITNGKEMTLFSKVQDETTICEKRKLQDIRIHRMTLQDKKECAYEFIEEIEAMKRESDTETSEEMSLARDFLQQDDIPLLALNEMIESLREKYTLICDE